MTGKTTRFLLKKKKKKKRQNPALTRGSRGQQQVGTQPYPDRQEQGSILQHRAAQGQTPPHVSASPPPAATAW